MDNGELQSKEGRLVELDAKLQVLADEVIKLRQEITEAKARFKVGDIIRWQNGSHKRRGRVLSIFPSYADNVGYCINIIRKDGTYGQRVNETDTKFLQMQIDEDHTAVPA